MENRAYKFRIYPTSQQETFLEKELGLKRLYWNLSLAAKNADHSYKLKSYKETFEQEVCERKTRTISKLLQSKI